MDGDNLIIQTTSFATFNLNNYDLMTCTQNGIAKKKYYNIIL